MLAFRFVVCIAVLALAAGRYSFIGIGDWGGAATTDEYKKNQYAVANQMALTIKNTDAQFIVNTGDNFYWCGLQNTSDFQVQETFVQPYKDISKDIPWYSILGNHEYAYDVDSQVDLTNILPNWYMPARYYSVRRELGQGKYMTLIALDSNPCIKKYRANSSKGWDPCGSHPTCSPLNTDDDFEGACLFHDHIITQSCTDQYEWLKKTLEEIPKDDWIIVTGHHAADEIDDEPITQAFVDHGFSIYLNGHSHFLNQYTLNGKGAWLTTGAGSLTPTADQQDSVTEAKLEGVDIDVNGNNVVTGEHIGQGGFEHKTIFKAKIAGFTLHTWNDDFSALKTEFIADNGEVLHAFESDINGNWKALDRRDE
jgi:hypothetical protein